MIDIFVVSDIFGGLSMLISVCFSNVRRLKCTKMECINCCINRTVERTFMSYEEMVDDGMPSVNAMDGINRASLHVVNNNDTFD